MKRLTSLLIKLGIVFGIGFAAVASNPSAQQHRAAIRAKVAHLQEQEVVGNLKRRLYAAPSETETDAFSYHNFFVASKITNEAGQMVSFGFFKRVFVTLSEA